MADVAPVAGPDRAPCVYFVVGENSGDALGADLMAALRQLSPDVRFAGLGGERMRALGLHSLFDISEISVMGLAGVVARLPLILRRIRQVANDITATKPDIVVLVDSPDFTHRVARRLKDRLPALPVVKYVCPSVWAWRPGRARAMRGHIDHVLALLPFEPAVLEQLGGPPATYVGHPRAQQIKAARVAGRAGVSPEPVVLVLPGSRRSETRLLLPDIRDTLEILSKRGNRFHAILPAVPHLEAEIRQSVANWPVKPEIVAGEAAKLDAFSKADVALAASGTVLLELALYRIPMISIYRLDWLMHMVRHLITGWTAALPNLITDAAIVPERVGDMIRPGWLARALEGLMREGPERQLQLDGFDRMVEIMARDEATGTIAARKILEIAKEKPARH